MKKTGSNNGIATGRRALVSTALIALLMAGGAKAAEGLNPQQQLAHDVYKELVEIDTTTAIGDTARAAEAMAARLKAAGFPEEDVHAFSPAPHKGNLVARLHGSGARKPILLVAHLDVVPALREDWTVDPFKLTEKDGYYYARGSADDKYMASTFITNLIRYKQEGYKPDRDIIVALETDEEILDENALGIQWLIKNHRDLIDAEFALNEGGGVGLKDGKPIRKAVGDYVKARTDRAPTGETLRAENTKGCFATRTSDWRGGTAVSRAVPNPGAWKDEIGEAAAKRISSSRRAPGNHRAYSSLQATGTITRGGGGLCRRSRTGSRRQKPAACRGGSGAPT